MGTWGTAIFSDDMASDVRGEYKVLLSAGIDSDTVEKALIGYYKDDIEMNSRDSSGFWLALALTEWNYGRLSNLVKEKALDIIDSGENLKYWYCPPNARLEEIARYLGYPGHKNDYEKRKKDLESLRETLMSPMKEPKKVKKQLGSRCPWKVGSLLAYQIITDKDLEANPLWGKYALLRIVKIIKRPLSSIIPDIAYNEVMLVGLYGWCGDSIPDPQIVSELEYIPFEDRVLECPKPLTDPKMFPQFPDEMRAQLINRLSGRRIETCADLDWRPYRETSKVITCLGADDSFEQGTPEYFKTDITEYGMYGLRAFDIELTYALKPYYKGKDACL